ncbi:hypothetical protein PsYK624_132360 [Phanerochaete sordida]|uniref:Uncharacterized protein n=1 Tax=Phanerochaete sordida TaxID=48140 RepID=A0A9P3GL68_9APHY|nr:hypothetical protein PsYK624_132360 [Phanerochaete sordida]
MVSAAAACLEESILLVILFHLQNGPPPPEDIPKRGLAPYSLVCRSWAETVRPLLLKLALRSADDASQLIAHLNAAQILARPLHAHITFVTIIGNQTPSDIHWAYNASGRLYSLFPQTGGAIARPIIEWTVEGTATPGSEERDVELEVSTLPPLSVPAPARPILSLTLRNCYLSSISSLAHLVGQTRVHAMTLENVTFAQAGRVVPHTIDASGRIYALNSIRIVGTAVPTEDLSNFVDFALLSKDQPLLEENTRTLVADCVNLILLLKPHQEAHVISIAWSGLEPTTDLKISMGPLDAV